METQERYAMNLEVIITNAINGGQARLARLRAEQEAEKRRRQQAEIEQLRQWMRLDLPELAETNPELVWSDKPSPYAFWTKEDKEVHLYADLGGRGDLHWIVTDGKSQDIIRSKGNDPDFTAQDRVTLSIAKFFGYEVPDGL
jgi:hypothetical protein